MKRSYLMLLGLSILALSACDNSSKPIIKHLKNGGFETSDLSGWKIESGDAFNDDSISSSSTFSFSYDDKGNQINNNKTGNWFLSGKGYDGTFSNGRTGAIRSSNFTITGDISMKIAGGSLTTNKGQDASYKNDNEVCFVGIYLAENDLLIARQTNEYFIEHTESYVDVNKYNSGVYNTDNFVEYSLDMSKYLSQEAYIRIVDNDRSWYYGYISVDDIRVGDELEQTEGDYYVKDHQYVEDVEAPSQYEIKNGGFETGSLAGWEVLEGQAFSHQGVNREAYWWNENITYNRDGDYHYGFYSPSSVGKMRSSTFILGGTGYVSFKLGGCKFNDLTYLSFYVLEGENEIEVARYTNDKYLDFQFPYVENGMRLLNLNQYVADLREYIGMSMFIEVVDKCTSSEDLGCITLDSVMTYYPQEEPFYLKNYFNAVNKINREIETKNEYQVLNGTFETGDLTGWTTSWNNDSDRIGYVTDRASWWDQYPYNRKGNYCFTGESDENKTGYLISSPFKVGGVGKISFSIGGGRDPRLCYLSINRASDNKEMYRFANEYFHDGDLSLINKGVNLMNMVNYVADISSLLNEEVYIKVTDNAVNSWGLISLDSVVTYYPTLDSVPNTYIAKNILPKEETTNEYQVVNGNFETGDLTGWTYEGNNFIKLAFDEVWWNEWYSFEKEGHYFLSGWAGEENKTGTLTSSAFKVGGANKMTFRLGGAKNSTTRIEIIDQSTKNVLASYKNDYFNDQMTKKYYYNGAPIVLSQDNIFMANMVLCVVDLSAFEGKEVQIRIVDEAENDWGLLFVDDFVTYYASNDDVPSEAKAISCI